MGDRTGISWTDATWNPLRGCSRVSAGCAHCYAETVAARFSGPGQPYDGLLHPTTRGWNGQLRFIEDALEHPLRWSRPRLIFVNSMSDLFHESVTDEWIDRIFAVMALAPRHTFQILTKRPGHMLEYLDLRTDNREHAIGEQMRIISGGRDPGMPELPLPNVWLGVSVEDQVTADLRIPLLLQCPAALRWLSCEPLLGPVDLERVLRRGWSVDPGDGKGGFVGQLDMPGQIDWVVVGGESGVCARPMQPEWARMLRDACAAACVPYYFKQWGEWAPADDDAGGERLTRIGKRKAGSLLDGVDHKAWPHSGVSDGTVGA